jgi:hypothetical protein
VIDYYLVVAQAYLLTGLNSLHNFAAACGGGSFFGFPPWYKYLDGKNSTVTSIIDNSTGVPVCTPVINSINDFWLIGLAVIEILLRVGMLAAVFFVVYAGIKYTNSRGNPDKIESAKKTLVDAIAGLVITIIATGVVSFIGKSFT